MEIEQLTVSTLPLSGKRFTTVTAPPGFSLAFSDATAETPIAPPITHTDAALKAAVAAAREIERDRILAKLHELRPLDEPYTRRDWALEQKGAKELWARMVKAINDTKGGE